MASAFNLTESMNIALQFKHSAAQLNAELNAVQRTIERRTFFGNLRLRLRTDGAAIEKQFGGINAAALAATSSVGALSHQVAQLPRLFQRNGRAVDGATKKMVDYQKNTIGAVTSTNGFSSAIHQTSRTLESSLGVMARWTAGFAGLAGVGRAVGDAFQYARAQLRLAQVSEQSFLGAGNMASQIKSLAVRTGASSQQLLGFSSTLAQAGMSKNRVRQFAPMAAALSQSSQIKNIEDVGPLAVVLSETFKMRSNDEIGSALGKVGALSRRYPTDYISLADSLKKMGPTFGAGEANFNQALAAAATIQNATQLSSEEIGTGIKTILTRLRSPNRQQTLRDKYGIELTENGKLLSFTEMNRRVNAAVGGLPEDDIRRTAVYEDIAGMHRINIFSALQDNMDSYEKILAELSATDGLKEVYTDQKIAAQALTTQFSKLSEAVGKVAYDTISAPIVQNGLGGLTRGLTSLLDSSSGLGLLGGAAAAKWASSKMGFRVPTAFQFGGLLPYTLDKKPRPKPPMSSDGQYMFDFMRPEKELRPVRHWVKTRGTALGKVAGRAMLSRAGIGGGAFLAGQMLSQSDGVGSQTAGAALTGFGGASLLGLNPFVAALAGGALALNKFTDAVEQSAEAQNDSRVNAAGTALEKSLTLGKPDAVKQSLQALANQAYFQKSATRTIGVGRTGLGMAQNLLTLDWGKLSASATRDEISGTRTENLQGRLSAYEDVLNDVTEAEAKRFASLQDFEKSATGSNILALFTAMGKDTDIVKSHISSMIAQNQMEKARAESARRAAEEADRVAQALNQLSSAVFTSELSLTKTRSGFESSTPNRLLNLSDPQSFLPQLNTDITSSKFRSSVGQIPGIDAGVNKLLGDLKTTFEKMPQWIDENRFAIPTGDRLATQLLSRPFANGLDPKITETLKNAAKAMSQSDWEEGLTKPNQLVSKLTNNFEPLLNEVNKTAIAFQELRTRQLENLTTVFDARSKAISADSTARAANAEVGEVIKQFAFSRGGNMRPTNFMFGERNTQTEVRALTGTNGVENIGRQIAVFTENLKQTGNPAFGLAIQNNISALQLLANSANRVSGMFNELSRVESFKAGKIGFGEMYYGSDINARRDMDRAMGLAVQATMQGRTVKNTSVFDQQEIIRGYQLMKGTGPLQSLGGKTAEQEIERYLNLPLQKENQVIQQLQNTIVKTMADSAKAQAEIAGYERENFKFLVDNLDRANKEVLQGISNVVNSLNAGQFANAVNQFNMGVNAFAKAASVIPHEIDHKSNVTVQVNHMGISWLNNLEPNIREIVKTEINNAIGKFSRKDPTRPPQMS